MKHPSLGLLALSCLALGVFAGCGGAAASPGSHQLDESLSSWSRAKGSSTSYSYEVPAGSWSGFGSTTTLVVKGDRVVARSYASSTPDPQSGKPTPLPGWEENEASVGSHTEGAAPRVLEQLYAQCRDDVLTRDRAANDVTLAFDDRGLLTTCVYVPKGCQDDCSFGVEIRNVKVGQ